MLNNPSFG